MKDGNLWEMRNKQVPTALASASSFQAAEQMPGTEAGVYKMKAQREEMQPEESLYKKERVLLQYSAEHCPAQKCEEITMARRERTTPKV